MNWKSWGNGLVAAVISGASDAVILNMVDPSTFNLSNGLRTLATVTGLFALKAGALYLKQHPIPTANDAVENPERLR